MSVIGTVASLWRYPVKSMRGEELQEAFIGFSGVYGDRLYAFTSSNARKNFPYLTAREREEMLLCRPRFRYPERAAKPPNLAEAEAVAPGNTPLHAGAADLVVDVEMPSGQVIAIDDPALIGELVKEFGDGRSVALLRSERALTDSRPVSLFSMQTVRQIGDEIGAVLDKRRFRANVYVDLGAGEGFAEEEFLGRSLRIGDKTVIAMVERDPRCKMITIDPDTAA
ncbi:MAG: MOSC domain-containing protein, partial [Pseudomonadota bacterium]|nr:MOSC domain-containing protein [Pseudomonadota bacterium]